MRFEFDEKDIDRMFGPGALEDAQPYIDAVRDIEWDGEDTLYAHVLAEEEQPYVVQLTFSRKYGQQTVRSFCTCLRSVGCAHAAALIYFFCKNPLPGRPLPVAREIRPDLHDWLSQLQSAKISSRELSATPRRPKRPSHALVYVVRHSHDLRADIVVYKARVPADGVVRTVTERWRSFENAILNPPSYVSEDDISLLLSLSRDESVRLGLGYDPEGPEGSALLERMIATGRAYVTTEVSDDAPGALVRLTRAGARVGTLGWSVSATGRLHTEVRLPSRSDIVIDHTEPCWYVDCKTGEAGHVEGVAAGAPLRTFLQMPPVSLDEAAALGELLEAVAPEYPAPPNTTDGTLEVLDIEPVPVLMLDSREVYKKDGRASFKVEIRDYARVSFIYREVQFDAATDTRLFQRDSGQVVAVKRRSESEAQRLGELHAAGLKAPRERVFCPEGAFPDDALVMDSPAAWPRFMREVLPTLRERGWQVGLAPTFQHNLVDIDTIEGRVSDAGNGWFDIEMGITVNGRQVRLEPLLAGLFARDGRWLSGKLESIADDEPIMLTTDQHEQLRLRAGRIKPVVRVLIDLFDDKGKQPMRVSAIDAARIEGLESLGRWQFHGAESVRELAQKLLAGPGVTEVAQPAGLRAELRAYQRQGLAWMQFLREKSLAGVLADDMGLGKTLQTLAHILTEKEQGRLDRPALVVVPTTLVHNWRDEAARFAPGLRVLDLHGPDRHERFDSIPQHDLVITTYPLLWRNEDGLSKFEYHLLVLDEAQYVKNATTRAAGVVRELRARHRLCLSGTPLENHLGELWSQFDFLLPGFLGTQQDFTRRWRTPIEKGGDTVRRALLAKRLRPFMLRRRKDEVATELPPRTVVVQTIEIEGAQRDLYETVRATMQKKVREAISDKGLNRSHIVVLDALLKLRQVCCDPRLVKSSKAAEVKGSAKLDALMQMLPELIEEGRRILVFSQFASMLELISQALNDIGIHHAMMTGDTTDRRKEIERFTQGEVPVFLISLKSGGVGLNLTAADTVIHYDPWWNPAVENQATDRAHRIGQDKPVFVYKLITAGSVEEKILALQDKKAALAQAMLSEDGAQMEKFTSEDLEALFAPIPEVGVQKKQRA